MNQIADYAPGYVPPMPDLGTYRNSAGVEVQAVQLTHENGRAVWEWADSKQFFSPNPTGGGGLVVAGLTIFTDRGRRKADFGDWVVRWTSGTFDRYDRATFGQFFTKAQA